MRIWAAAFLMTIGVSAAIAEDVDPTFKDPIDTPASKTTRVPQSPYIAVTRAGTRWVAAGLRGLIAISEDGKTWRQAEVPVSSDLVALSFADADQGWAVGHDGVIVHTVDGGLRWTKQLDGRSGAKLALASYESGAAAGDLVAAAALKTTQLNYQNGPDLPLLGVWFESIEVGYAVGAFGLMFFTADGGAHWQPWFDHIDNPQGLNLNAIRGVDGEIFIAAEKGQVFKLDRAAKRFVAVPTGYAGSFFDVTGGAGVLLAFGLRGTVYRSLDHGLHWTLQPSGVDTGLSAGTQLADGSIVLVSQGGQALISVDQGARFTALNVGAPALFTGVFASGREIALSSYSGMRVQALSVEAP